ncbi:MAG: hypothetical protein QM743_04265 [Chitinophagaceae bacterium]
MAELLKPWVLDKVYLCLRYCAGTGKQQDDNTSHSYLITKRKQEVFGAFIRDGTGYHNA